MSLPRLPPVVVLCMHSALLGGSEQTALLRQAWAQGLADGRLVFLPYDTMLFALPYRNRSYPALGQGGPLREVYDAVLSVTLESGPVDKVVKAVGASEEGAAHPDPEQVGQCRPSPGSEHGARGRCARAPPPCRPSWPWPAAHLACQSHLPCGHRTHPLFDKGSLSGPWNTLFLS